MSAIWRVGQHYGHVYEGERPVDTFHQARDAELPEPWALLPTEVVCRNDGCNLAFHRHLPECPNCKELHREAALPR